MRHKVNGFSLLELMMVVAIVLVVMGMALPSVVNGLKAYRVHSDAGALASYLSVVRMRAASQYVPYRLVVNPTAGNYVIEQLAAVTYNPFGTPGSTTYSAQSPAVYESGTQYFNQGTTAAACRPSGISAYPSPVTANPASCTGNLYVYFNTRGLPVDNTGSALTSGGAAIYLTGADGTTDAVTVSAGGAVQTWNWSSASSTWSTR